MSKRYKKSKVGGSTPQQRKHLFRNQVTSLFKLESIKTTLPKAKQLMRVADTMITHAKRGTLADYRKASGYIREQPVLRKTFTELAERYKFRPGGYTRVVRTFRRRIDNAPMAFIELVDRAGEFRAPRPVDYLTAVEKKLVPEPLSPIRNSRELAIASAISPSTSNRVAPNRPHFRRVIPDHLIFYPTFTRRTHRKPSFLKQDFDAVGKNIQQQRHESRFLKIKNPVKGGSAPAAGMNVDGAALDASTKKSSSALH